VNGNEGLDTKPKEARANGAVLPGIVEPLEGDDADIGFLDDDFSD